MIFKQNSQFYRAALKMSFGCVAQLDHDGVILHFDNYLDSISSGEAKGFVGKKWIDLFSPMNGHADYYNEVVLGSGCCEAPEKILAEYDQRLFMEWKFLTTPAQESSGEAGRRSPGILGVAIDVTKYMELKQQLTHADRLATVGQLAAGIAHEINGPVNNILGYAQLSAKQQDLPEQVYQDLDNIIRLSLHAREVVKKVMLFSRQVPPKHDWVDLNKVVTEGLHFTEPMCRQNQVDVDCLGEDDLPGIEGDYAQLRQVMVNLVVNAVQSMGGGPGKIEIRLARKGDQHVVVQIRDNGSGMSETTLKQCFMPFFTTKDIHEGTGLGLSVVHGIIESHNGVITAQSTLGEGSEFKVIFPVYTRDTDKEGA